jgi:hypothetical protein
MFTSYVSTKTLESLLSQDQDAKLLLQFGRWGLSESDDENRHVLPC